jgi:hypothetical protein
MSVKVDPARLADTLRDYGFAYLLTVGDDQRAHAVAVRPSYDGRVLRVDGLGRRTRANLGARADVTLLYPPFEHGGYSLIVDGHAEVSEEGAAVAPQHAVLHRPADHETAGSVDGCGSDCLPVAGP